MARLPSTSKAEGQALQFMGSSSLAPLQRRGAVLVLNSKALGQPTPSLVDGESAQGHLPPGLGADLEIFRLRGSELSFRYPRCCHD
jgi:hypothetical protein